jgi:hypothetical protein
VCLEFNGWKMCCITKTHSWRFFFLSLLLSSLSLLCLISEFSSKSISKTHLLSSNSICLYDSKISCTNLCSSTSWWNTCCCCWTTNEHWYCWPSTSNGSSRSSKTWWTHCMGDIYLFWTDMRGWRTKGYRT